MLEELKTRHKLRFEFWKKLLEKVNKSETQLFKNINPSKDYWLAAGIGISGLGLNFVISKNYGRSELMLARGVSQENKYFFDELFKRREQIESDFGGDLIWERLDDKKSCRIKYEIEGFSYYDNEDWEKMMNFMIDGMIRMEKALINPLRAINIMLKKQGME